MTKLSSPRFGFAFSFALSSVLALAQAAEPFWTRSYFTWTEAEIERLQRSSPWAVEMHMLHGIIATKANGRGTQKAVLNVPITVRWVSPLAMRRALARFTSIHTKRSDEDTEKAVAPAYMEFVIDIARRGDALDYPATARITPEEEADWQKCTLGAGGGAVTPRKVMITGMQNSVARLWFPRDVGGKPLVTPQDKTILLKCVSTKVTFGARFDLTRMVTDGKLDL